MDPSSTSMQSSGQGDIQAHSSDQEEVQEHLLGQEGRQSQSLPQLADLIHKAMSTMSHTNCSDEINRKFVEEIMEQVGEMAKDAQYRDESTKAQLDALGTRMWNSALMMRADAGQNAKQETVSVIALIRRTACLLLNMCRMEKEDIESSQKIVTVCARTAMDLYQSDERVMAEEMIGMAAECVEPLEKIDTDAGVFDNDYKDSVFEAVCAYRLARFQLSTGNNEAVMSHFMHKALSSCKKLTSDCWVARATLKFAVEFAIKVIEEEERRGDDIQKDVTKVQEVKIFLGSVHAIMEKKPYAECPEYKRSRLDVEFLLSRVQYITGKLNGKEENILEAEEALRRAVKQAKDMNAKAESTKASLLIISMMEERKAPLEKMLQEWRDLVLDLDFGETNINTIVKILFRTFIRKPARYSEYILRVIGDICQCILKSRLDKVSCATHIGKLGFVAVKAAGIDCTKQLADFFDMMQQSVPPIQLSEEMGYAWLDALLKSANEDESRDKEDAISLLSLACHPTLAKPENTAYVAVKKAAYLLMQAGRHDECNQMIMEQMPGSDLPSSLILCVSFIRQRKELQAGKVLDTFEADEWSANVLLWIVSEAFAQGMTNLQSRAMVMFLAVCPATDHNLNIIRLIRTVVTKYIDLLQNITDPEEQEATFHTLSDLISRYDTMMLTASQEDKQSKEKAQEADWIISSLYKLTIYSDNSLTPLMLERLDRTIVQIADYREGFEEPCPLQIHVLRFYAGFRSLLEFKKTISASRQTVETEDNLREAWRRTVKCERDLSLAVTKDKYNEARENDKLAILALKVELLLEMQKNHEVKSILEREEEPLEYEATEQVARIILQHPKSEPFLLQAAMKRLVKLFKDRARTHGSYPAHEVAEWLRHVVDKLSKHTHSLVYSDIIELLGHLMIPLWRDTGFVANPPWPPTELLFFQRKARELAYDLAKQGRVEPAHQLVLISGDILQDIPDLPKETYEAEMARLDNIHQLLESGQSNTFYHHIPNTRATSYTPQSSTSHFDMF